MPHASRRFFDSSIQPAIVDGDGDGVADASDNCPTVPNDTQANHDTDAMGDACDTDDDDDGVADADDNCSVDPNPGQVDSDKDSQGDACDPDDDNDTVLDAADNCVLVPNSGQADADGDAIGNACDPDGVVAGQGTNVPVTKLPNTFSIGSLKQGGSLVYKSMKTTLKFDGVISCVRIVGNSATIVAYDNTRKLANRTMVRDNGSTGDKLINTMFDPAKMTAKAAAANQTCITPDTAKLNAANALVGDAVQITGAATPGH